MTEPNRRGTLAATFMPAGAGEPGWTVTLAAATALAMLTFIIFYLISTQVPYYLAEIGHPEPAASAVVLATVTLPGGAVSAPL